MNVPGTSYKYTSTSQALRVAASFSARARMSTSHEEILQDMVNSTALAFKPSGVRVAFYHIDPFGSLHIHKANTESILEESHVNGIPPEGPLKTAINSRGFVYVPDILQPHFFCDVLDGKTNFGPIKYDLDGDTTRGYIERYGDLFRSKGKKMDMLFGCLSIPGHDNCPEQVLGVIRADSFPAGESLLPRKMGPEALLDVCAIVCNAAAQSLDELRIRTELEHEKKEAQARFAKAQDLMRRMKHDFASALTIPSGYVQMLKRNDLSEEQRTDVTGKAYDAIRRISPRLEKYSEQIRTGNFDLAVNLNPIKFGSIFRSLIEIKYDIEIDPNVPETVVTDESHVKEVLYGLIENARKFCDREAKIRITCRAEGNRIVISVIDNGKGLDQVQKKKIFEGGYRAHAHLPGSGFGLYGYKKIVEKLGGEIWAESEGLGKGSTIKFTLPIT